MIYTVTLNTTIDLVYETGQINKYQLNKTRLKSLSAGGKGINISRALLSLGVESKALGFYGGRLKSLMDQALKKEKIDFEFTPTESESRINIKIMETVNGNVAEFNEYGNPVRACDLEKFLEIIENRCSVGDYFILAGSLPPGIDEAVYKMLIETLKHKGAKVLLDTSGNPLALGIESIPDYLSINLEELRSINGKDIHPEIISAEYIKEGISRIMVTDGPREAFYCDKSVCLKGFPPKTAGSSSVGSGDSADAGFIYGILQKMDAEQLLGFSLACGSANLLDPVPGRFEIGTVLELAGRTKVCSLGHLQ